ncbi:hypothetical protein MMC07_006337 [Pseudocyphellaria aurata]|nr:hypothetical protein [Pseudocyphellaria aurata]
MAQTLPTATQEVLPDDRPIATRRKRRGSTAITNRDNGANNPAEYLSNPTDVASDGAKTPTKPKKRVRFSDPGPEPAASSSTGLTPRMRRSHLKSSSSIPNIRLLSEKPRKRRSLPSDLSTSLPSPSLSPPPTPFISGEVQFAPLRQVLDERLKRRLRRNNLSEEINDMNAEKKSCSHLKQQVQELRNELAVARQLGKEVNDVAEDEGGDSERVQGLEEENATLRQKMQERSTTAEPPGCANISSTPASSTYSDGGVDDDFLMVNFDENGAKRDDASVQAAPFIAEAATQVSIPSPTLTATLRSARLTLEHLFPGEITLGLGIDDPELLLNVIIERLPDLKVQIVMAETALSSSKTQEANLRNSFNAVLQQLARSRSYGDEMSAQHANEKAKADRGEQKIQLLEVDYKQALGNVKEIEADLDEKQRSNRKLQDALETYRVEVRKLETVVTTLEANHNNAISGLRREMQEAVVDLECHVAAEATGRRAAEKEAVERGDRIRQLEQLEQELKGAMSEKQLTIRDMEKQIADVNDGREKEVGVMNVTIANMTSSLEEAKSKLARMEAEKMLLLGSLEEEKAAAREAVEAMQSEMEKTLEMVEGIKDSYVKDMQSRGAEVAEHRGLLTPVSACRFKDVEGYVEVKRGKSDGRRRLDGGIGVVEEDEFEDIMVEDA